MDEDALCSGFEGTVSKLELVELVEASQRAGTAVRGGVAEWSASYALSRSKDSMDAGGDGEERLWSG